MLTSKTYIRAGYGFDVQMDFARAWDNLPIELAPNERAAPRHVIGYIAGDPQSKVAFLRPARIRVHVPLQYIGGIE